MFSFKLTLLPPRSSSKKPQHQALATRAVQEAPKTLQTIVIYCPWKRRKIQETSPLHKEP